MFTAKEDCLGNSLVHTPRSLAFPPASSTMTFFNPDKWFEPLDFEGHNRSPSHHPLLHVTQATEIRTLD